MTQSWRRREPGKLLGGLRVLAERQFQTLQQHLCAIISMLSRCLMLSKCMEGEHETYPEAVEREAEASSKKLIGFQHQHHENRQIPERKTVNHTACKLTPKTNQKTTKNFRQSKLKITHENRPNRDGQSNKSIYTSARRRLGLSRSRPCTAGRSRVRATGRSPSSGPTSNPLLPRRG